LDKEYEASSFKLLSAASAVWPKKLHLPAPPFFAGRQMLFDFEPDPRNSIFALDSISLEQRSFARRDLHNLVYCAGPRDWRHYATANAYRWFGFVYFMLSLCQPDFDDSANRSLGIGTSMLSRLVSRAELAFNQSPSGNRLLR
jgi:hypothetical protein